MKKKRPILLVAFGCLALLRAFAAPVSIAPTPSAGSFTICGESTLDQAVILYDARDAEVVTTCLSSFISDIRAVCGKTLARYTTLPQGRCPIIVGTIGQNKHIDDLVQRGKLDVSDVQGKWEAYGIQTIADPMEGVERALVLYGSQPRSTAYAMFELTRMMGVSPWIWWADVAPAKQNRLYATDGKTVYGSPSVKFRGIFLNDEDYGLRPWAARKMDTGLNNFGPKTYGAIMELLLRLRANTLWPAMHAGSRAFWFEKTNLPLITKYDIYMGSSHCEQMLRDNEYEWNKFGGNGNDNWVWHSNQEMIKRYWAERVGESRGKNAIYTLGMRGVHDSGINGYNTTAERVAALTDIIRYQRQLLADSIGDPTTIPQIFIPYKEVMTCYNAGLKVPDDVTLMWVDDNHGYIRQLPNRQEQARSGGNAVYYHLSYWGTPASYLWLSTISPTLCCYELSKAYDQGVRDQWIINVGDIKPAELELEFCMDLAWDIQRWTPETAHLYTRYWAAKTFGEEYADEINDIKNEYYRLALAGKPEQVQLCSFDFSNRQIDQRIEQYQTIYRRTQELSARIPFTLRDAFYQLVEYPVMACANQNIKLLRARQSFLYARAGQGDKALAYSAQAAGAFNEIVTMTNKYNTGIARGKWDGMMSYKPNNWEQHLMPAVATAADIGTVTSTILEPRIHIVPGGAYTTASSSVKVIQELGIEGTSATVWPLNTTAYSSTGSAPYAEYTVPVTEGLNVIQVRCLPTFPLNTSYDLRAGVEVDGKTPSVISIQTTAMSQTWEETVAQGYFPAAVHYNSTEDKEIRVRVYFMDPGLTISAVASIPFTAGVRDLTNELLTNADFEYNATGAPNPQGATGRGYPRGWRNLGTLNGNSWGVNQDVKHGYGINAFWASSMPLPNSFELYQLIPATKLEAGTYMVSCLLGTFQEKLGTCRLFANKQVQYYGKPGDYTPGMLTAGETNTFAGYGGSGSGKMTLKPMQVLVTIGEGETLRVGIRTSNHKADGTRSTGDNHGWFKVDHFRIQKIDAEYETGLGKVEEKRYYGQDTFDLSGRRVDAARLQGGIYITGGRKVVLP